MTTTRIPFYFAYDARDQKILSNRQESHSFQDRVSPIFRSLEVPSVKNPGRWDIEISKVQD